MKANEKILSETASVVAIGVNDDDSGVRVVNQHGDDSRWWGATGDGTVPKERLDE